MRGTEWMTDDRELARLRDYELMRLLQQQWGRKIRQRLEDEARTRDLIF